MAEQKLMADSIVKQFRANGVTHVVWLPDSETNFMYQELVSEPSLEIITICREGESMPISAGLWMGGKKPVTMIQNTGMFEAGDSIRGWALDIDLPLVLMIGYRGWTRHGATGDSAARFTEPILHAWGINYYLIESDGDTERITMAFEEAEQLSRPVACLIGAEYG